MVQWKTKKWAGLSQPAPSRATLALEALQQGKAVCLHLEDGTVVLRKENDQFVAQWEAHKRVLTLQEVTGLLRFFDGTFQSWRIELLE
jgi:hypothetical protein